MSFNGMQSLLVLYMVGQVLLPGHVEHVAGFLEFRQAIESLTGPLSTQALGLQLFGLYIGLVSFTPLLGGVLGDRLLGRRLAVMLGALLMSAGHFCMAFERSFLWALVLLIVGAGFMRGNLASQMGALYAEGDPRRAAAFQVYYLVINCASFIAPVITGLLWKDYGWRYGFGFAGIGMLIGLVIYLAGQTALPLNPTRTSAPRRPLSHAERSRILVLVLLVPLLALFWTGQSQVWNTYNIWARDHLNMMVFGWSMPLPWLRAFDNLAAVLLVPPILLFWRWQARRRSEPDEFSKIAIGCAIFSLALLWLAVGGSRSSPSGQMPLLWALAFHVVANAGWVYFAPTVVALFTRAAPASVNSTMVGVSYLAIFLGSVAGGRLGALYERYTPNRFWLLHAALVGAAAILVAVLAPSLRRVLPTRAAELHRS